MKKQSSNEHTSSHVATIAGRLLRNPKTSKQVKSLAASALTQVRERRKSFAYNTQHTEIRNEKVEGLKG